MRRRLSLPGDRGRAATLTLGVLRGDKGLDESVSALGVERQGVAQGGQLGTLLHKGLLQTVSSSVEVLLQRAGTAKSIQFQVSLGLTRRLLSVKVSTLHFNEQGREGDKS